MNSIYDILNKLNNIQPAVDVPATEPVKQKSKLQESIDTVNEKYMGFKKVAAAAKAGGAKDPDAVAAAIGREKYGKEKFQKAAAAGKKLGEEQTTYNKDEIIQMLTGRKTQAQVDTDRKRAAQTTTPPTDANAQTNEGIEKLSIGQQMARDGITYSVEREKELIGIIGDYLAKNGHSEKAIRYYLSYDEDFVPDTLSELPKEGVAEEKPVEEWANSPEGVEGDEEYQGIEAAIPSGDDLHREKGAYPAAAGGDNPMAIDEEMWAAYQALKSELQ